MFFLALLLQAQSQTVCQNIAGRVVCETRKAPDPLDYQATMDAAGRSVSQPRPPLRQQRLDLQGQVAEMLQDGDCAGAKRVALGAGDVDLAAKAATICEK